MRVLIVEDEAPAARRLQRLVATELGIDTENITISECVEEACQAIAQQVFDVMLLDLDLSGRDGFALLGSAGVKTISVVIVSANVDRALEAFEHGVVDFIGKPVVAERLVLALRRAQTVCDDDMRLAVRSRGHVDVVQVKKVSVFSGAGDYVEILLQDQQTYLHQERLDALAKRLPANFMRVHRSHIINGEDVVQLRKVGRGQFLIVMQNGNEVPVSRRRAKLVQDRFYKLAKT